MGENLKRLILLCCITAITFLILDCTAKFDNSRIRSLNIDARQYYDQGMQYSRENRIDDAITAYTISINFNPSAGAYNNRSAEFNRKGRYDMAISDANQAIFLNSKYPMPYFNRGNAYFKKSDYSNALKNYTRAISLDPDQAEFYYNLGQTYVRMGQDDKAVDAYEKAVKVDPHYVSAYYNMACVFSKLNKVTQALASLEKAVSEGFMDTARIKQETALNNISKTARFRVLLQKLEKKVKGAQ